MSGVYKKQGHNGNKIILAIWPNREQLDALLVRFLLKDGLSLAGGPLVPSDRAAEQRGYKNLARSVLW